MEELPSFGVIFRVFQKSVSECNIFIQKINACQSVNSMHCMQMIYLFYPLLINPKITKEMQDTMISLKELTFLIAKQENKYERNIKTLRKKYQ